jgi:hypothetical protein
VREVDVTVGGTRFLRSRTRPACRGAQDFAVRLPDDIAPAPIFVGVEQPMKTYTIDNILFTTYPR